MEGSVQTALFASDENHVNNRKISSVDAFGFIFVRDKPMFQERGRSARVPVERYVGIPCFAKNSVGPCLFGSAEIQSESLRSLPSIAIRRRFR